MKGISYITDDHNKIKAVVIDYKLFRTPGEEIENIMDVLIAETRKDEQSIPFDTLMKNLKKKGKL